MPEASTRDDLTFAISNFSFDEEQTSSDSFLGSFCLSPPQKHRFAPWSISFMDDEEEATFLVHDWRAMGPLSLICIACCFPAPFVMHSFGVSPKLTTTIFFTLLVQFAARMCSMSTCDVWNLQGRDKRVEIGSVLTIVTVNLQWCAMYFGHGIASFAESGASFFLLTCFVLFITMQSIASFCSIGNPYLCFLMFVHAVAAVIWKVALFQDASTVIDIPFTVAQLVYSSIVDTMGIFVVSIIMQYDRRLHWLRSAELRQQTLRIADEKERLLFELHMAKKCRNVANLPSETSFGTCSEIVALKLA